ncbi:hypothetical protein DEH69_16110 [Streptomyces sp. PT12]|nr:hypothetical protein DEH69_16110 [Streptomyces sp. PT12]
MIVDTDVNRARGLYGRLIDTAATRFGAALDLDPDDRADEVSRRLAELFGARPGIEGVMLRLDGRDVGVATPRRLRAAEGLAGPAAEWGAGDRAGLPGRSGRYRPVWFDCATPGCGAAEARSFYDERAVPVCPDERHGPMELRR